MADFYLHGEVVEKNLAEYRAWLEKAAELGDAQAQNRLGVCYHDGKGTDPNEEKAAYWYKMAADNGHKDACNKLAVIYHDEKKDYNQALSYLTKAMELGCEDAYFNLGYLYEQGRGTEKDFTKKVL